ncbi:signal peptidase II [Brachyspira hyodysenteriae]|uniref:Lipoprotein signal peptidase n=1 Tax=Brachyspira hyodysenteriae ATCC 27164 TaxID=1266923 RepID=A0A3B6VV69_BRAHO|nr:signal peptidase II [Brachyspira hyodysenteriae]ANN63529.1 signal peptidase II [Brachyspira hyodysenteriae ATCC 27164]KLI22126.1 peptidase A8 [Brachyspira hyodysenteriae]KLI37403.1 peptidase A8 [Brachyspira hyodysenteriae]MCZ9925376.1 signal peptidase II [Brachyspira hyodysenteriae]MCZ9961888.1 signal peptidase II [Brachyspira hyodysenteriae]
MIKLNTIKEEIKQKKIYFLTAMLIFIADTISKYFIDKYLQETIIKRVIGDILIFIYTRNYGVSFGFLNNVPETIQHIIPELLKVIVFIAMIIIFFIMISINVKKQKLSMIGFTMVLGGAMGNLVDRIMRGYVTDFISMGFNETIRFPYNYNIADASITIGICIIAIGVFFFKEDFDKKKNIESNNNTENN